MCATGWGTESPILYRRDLDYDALMWDALSAFRPYLSLALPALVLIRLVRVDPDAFYARGPIDTGPYTPCWTETIRSEGGLILGRAECVNDVLMEMDARAARGDFPIPAPRGE